MIIDVTGIELNPLNGGKECKGNGNHFDENGMLIECCCDECDYLACCMLDDINCSECTDDYCPMKMKLK